MSVLQDLINRTINIAVRENFSLATSIFIARPTPENHGAMEQAANAVRGAAICGDAFMRTLWEGPVSAIVPTLAREFETLHVIAEEYSTRGEINPIGGL